MFCSGDWKPSQASGQEAASWPGLPLLSAFSVPGLSSCPDSPAGLISGFGNERSPPCYVVDELGFSRETASQVQEPEGSVHILQRLRSPPVYHLSTSWRPRKAGHVAPSESKA